MLEDPVFRAALAGIGLSLATGPLGSVVVWRRMAYFGDAVAHAAILGVAIALAFSVPILAGALMVALFVGLSVSAMVTGGRPIDTNLGVLSYSALAVGLVGISFFQDDQIDVEALLFGDILEMTQTQLVLIWGGSFLALATLVVRWSGLLTATVSEELAASAGINPRRERMVLTVTLALVVALAVKVVGVLLVGALLIIPAAAARGFARSPEQMAVTAAVFGAAASVTGVLGAAAIGTPPGPSIVVVTTLIFVVSLVSGRLRR